MTDQQKTSRVKHIPRGNVNVQKKFLASDLHSTSFYEIDILGPYSSRKHESNDESIKVSFHKNSPKTSKARSKQNKDEYVCSENHFYKAYYPTLHDVVSQEESNRVEKNEPSNRCQSKKKERNTFTDNLGNESYSSNTACENNLKKQIKNLIIENLISKTDNPVKSSYNNKSDEKTDNDTLHIHHHEHHHHFYFHNNSILNEDVGLGLALRQACQEFKKEPDQKNSNRDKTDSFKPNPTYYFNGPDESNVNLTFTRERSRPRSETRHKYKDEKSQEVFLSPKTKVSSSAESIFNRKSDFLTSHVYSQTDLINRNGYDTTETGFTESEKSKKALKNTYSSLVNSLKSLNQFMSPIVITDRERVPDISFVKCKCTGVNLLDSKRSEFYKAYFDRAGSNSMTYGETTSETVEASDQTSGTIQGLLLNTWTESTEKRLCEDLFSGRLRAELLRIKKILHRLEEIHFEKRKSISWDFNDSEETGDSWNSTKSHRISVYSDKTFIFGSDDVLNLEAGKENGSLDSVQYLFNKRSERNKRKKNKGFTEDKFPSKNRWHQRMFSKKIYATSSKGLN